ncbi:MAG: phenylalanine--tRNA ligase subunit beta [Balneolaceae bacterium]
MKISYSWLKTYIDTDLSAEEVADKLTLLGLEVEEIDTTGTGTEGMVVGEILRVEDHPSADKLRICTVNLGDRRVQIICGANNVSEGQKVPVATVGTALPSATGSGSAAKIRKMKLRGEISEGMICSEAELGISEDHSGIMVLDKETEAGTPLGEALEIRRETVFEIGLTPNRPDASCHIGVARDLAAVLEKKLHNPYKADPVKQKNLDEMIAIEIRDTDQCHRYAGKIVKNIQVAESPVWLKQRLQSIGLRPVNNVVDATNYILHEIGQPLHAFDYSLIEDKRIVVDSFRRDTTFKTLDNVERTVPAGTLFICDGDKPVAIAGIMGGKNSEVTEKTDTILIESAYFSPTSIRKSSKELGVQTDSSYRFERGIDPDLALRAAERAAELIADLTGGTVAEGYSDIHPVKTEPRVVPLRIDRLNSLLGTGLDQKYVASVLNALEIQTYSRKKGELQCTVPTFRPDVQREVDLIEEVGRIFDYNNIPRPESAPFHSPAPLSSWELFHKRVRTIAARLKYKEISTNSLHSLKEESYFSEADQQIHTLNPVSQEATTLRTTLRAGFLKTLQYNLNRKAGQLRFFEIGHTYRRSDNGTWISGIEEHSKLLLGVCGLRQTENWRHGEEPYELFDLKSDLESFFLQMGMKTRLDTSVISPVQLNYLYKEVTVATLVPIGEETSREYDINTPAFAAEVDLSLLYQAGIADSGKRYEAVSRFPSFEYDVAYTVDRSVSAEMLVRLIRKEAGKVLKDLDVFDVYEGGNLGIKKKSIAFRLTFLDSNKTLNINDVEPVVQKITRVLEAELGAKLRS